VDELLTRDETAKLLHLHPRTLLRLARDGGGPKFIRAGGRRVLYARTDLEAWISSRSFKTRAEEATNG
jgi:excisionase family DNA binding protein